MIQTLVCPQCRQKIEISQALQHEIMEEAVAEERRKYEKKLEVLTEEIKNKATKEMQEEIALAEKRNREYVEQLTQARHEVREMKVKDQERQLEMEKKLAAVQDEIRQEAARKTEEEHRLKDMEKDRKLQEVLKMNEELRRKLEQGSQQSQGEVLELHLEEMLRREFPGDEIMAVGKGVRGGDVVQVVVDKYGRKCGVVLWESKNAKWSEGWIEKLAEDKRAAKADLAALVSVNLPDTVSRFGYYRGVWVADPGCILGLAWSLRINLGQVYMARLTAEGKMEKAGEVYDYITGVEFKNRVEGILEAYQGLKDELDREKRWYGVKWAREEKEINKVIENVVGLYGELQGISGRALPDIKSLDGPSGQLELGAGQ